MFSNNVSSYECKSKEIMGSGGSCHWNRKSYQGKEVVAKQNYCSPACYFMKRRVTATLRGHTVSYENFFMSSIQLLTHHIANFLLNSLVIFMFQEILL